MGLPPGALPNVAPRRHKGQSIYSQQGDRGARHDITEGREGGLSLSVAVEPDGILFEQRSVGALAHFNLSPDRAPPPTWPVARPYTHQRRLQLFCPPRYEYHPGSALRKDHERGRVRVSNQAFWPTVEPRTLASQSDRILSLAIPSNPNRFC